MMRNPVRRPSLALALLLAAATLVGVARPAGACTCAPFDTRAVLAASDAAFVGTLLSRADPPPALDGTPAAGGDTIYRFRVDQAVKGPLDGEVEVRAPGSEASCGLSAPSGRPVGVLLSERDGHYHGDLCRQPSPERLVRAAEPLPAPEGRLPPWIVVGSTYGNGRSVALDDGGRVAGVGSGPGTTTAVAVCPDRQRVVELFTVTGPDGTDTQGITVRRLDTMASEAERLLSDLRPARVETIACRDRGATDLVLITAQGTEADGRERLVRLVAGHDATVLWEGPAARHAAFGPGGRTAYLNLYPQGEEVLAIDVDQPGEAAVVARVPAGSGPMAVSADGRRLATVSVGSSRPSQVVSVDLGSASTAGAPRAPGTPVVSTADLGSAGVTGDVQWSGDTLVFMPALRPAEAVRIYDPGLTVLASWAGWTAEHSVVIGERLYGASQGAVRSAALTTGPASVVRELEDALVVSIADVSPLRVSAPPAPAATTTTTTTAPPATATSTTTVRRPSPTTTTTVPQATTTTTAAPPERSPEARPEVAGKTASKGGGGGAGGVLALAGVLVLLGGGAVLFRLRRRR
jgi:hypothetical protein